MKKFFIIALVSVILTGCSSSIPYVVDASFIDYSVYSKNGVFLTESNSVNFEYEPVGSVSSTVFSGNIKGVKKSSFIDEELYTKESTERCNKWKKADVRDAISQLVEVAKNQGANGIINLKIQPISEKTSENTYRTGFLVTGMAIKK